jgi:hypothetical protein
MAHQLPGRFIIIAQRRGNQRASVKIISHAFHNVSTLPDMTARCASWLQDFFRENFCNRAPLPAVIHLQKRSI